MSNLKRTLEAGAQKRRRFCLGLLFTLSFSSASYAEVYEIDDGGALRSRTGSGAVTWSEAGAQDVAEPDAVEALDFVGDTQIPEAAFVSLNAPSAPTNFQDALVSIAAANDLSPNLIEALIWQESRWNVRAVSPAGARGLAQLMPGTARQLGVNAGDPVANMAGGARYLRMQMDRFDGNIELALAAYNSGPERVAKLGRIPNIRETQNYVAVILARLAATQP